MHRYPTCLQAQAEQAANDTHSRRLAELQALAPLLAQLDTLLPQLAERGLSVYPDSLRLQQVRDYGASRRKALRLDTGATIMDRSGVRRWHEALLAMGFAEVHRIASAYFPLALMRRGTLLLLIDLPRIDPQAAILAAPALEEAA